MPLTSVTLHAVEAEAAQVDVFTGRGWPTTPPEFTNLDLSAARPHAEPWRFDGQQWVSTHPSRPATVRPTQGGYEWATGELIGGGRDHGFSPSLLHALAQATYPHGAPAPKRHPL